MTDELRFHSWGFDVFVPPTPFSRPPEPARFVMLDDLNNVFYDVDYETAVLDNKVTWTSLALHKVEDPAIVFPPEQQNMLHKIKFAAGWLVSIEERAEDVIHARRIGNVFVKPVPQEFMNWGALEALKGPELPEEMRAGLLRRVWSKGKGESGQSSGEYVTPAATLNTMRSSFHENGAALNSVLDHRFVGAQAIGPPSCWRVSGLTPDEMLKSRTRAAVFIDNSGDST